MLVKSEIDLLRMVKRFIRLPYAFPGGYPLALLTMNGDVLCRDCAFSEWNLICEESFNNTNWGFRIADVFINWEDSDLYCDDCNKKMESAYGE